MTDPTQSTCTPFIVLFHVRSGSTFLVEALNSHPAIHAEKECLVPISKMIERGKAEPDTQTVWARHFWNTLPWPGCRAVGFKTKLRDIRDPGPFADLLREVRARVILLHRRNVIKQVVSLANAVRLNDETGDWNLYRETDRQALLNLSLTQFDLWLQKVEQRKQALVDYVSTLQQPTLELFYEDLLTDTSGSFDRVCSHLGVPL